MRISKSKFVAGVQCLKRLYLEVHQPELAGEQRAATQAVIDQGREVGLVAQTAFPGGLTVEAGHKDLNAALIQSLQLIANPEAPAIFEAAFEHGDVLVRTDVLQRKTRLGHRLIEVKSATSVKPYYAYDVALQMHVLTGAGIEIEQINLMHLNRDYVFDGKAHDVSKLFVIAEISKDDAVSDGEVSGRLKEQFRILNETTPPDVQPGKHCTNPVVCEFFNHCNPILLGLANLP